MKTFFSRVAKRARRTSPAPADVPVWRPVFYKTLSVHLLETTASTGRRRI